MKHRPTPWHIHGEVHGLPQCVSIAWSQDGELVADSVYKENAEFIVRVCNLHQKLLEELYAYRSLLEAMSLKEEMDALDILLDEAEAQQ